MTPERYFFMYAYPCTYSHLIRKEMAQEEYDRLSSLFKEGSSPSAQDLERVYEDAAGEIRRIAELQRKNQWDIDVIRSYWFIEHNKVIDEGRNSYDTVPSKIRESCKVHFSRVKKVSEGKAEVEYNGKTVKVSNIIDNLKPNDFVTIHLGQVIEKIDEETYRRYAK